MQTKAGDLTEIVHFLAYNYARRDDICDLRNVIKCDSRVIWNLESVPVRYDESPPTRNRRVVIAKLNSIAAFSFKRTISMYLRLRFLLLFFFFFFSFCHPVRQNSISRAFDDQRKAFATQVVPSSSSIECFPLLFFSFLSKFKPVRSERRFSGQTTRRTSLAG